LITIRKNPILNDFENTEGDNKFSYIVKAEVIGPVYDNDVLNLIS
jgi:hypothetical protein